MKQLAAEPFVLFHRAGAPELFDAIVSLCSRAGFTPRVVNEADMMQTVLTLVDAGEGVALVPACVSNLRGSGIVLRPVQPDTVRIPLVMVWPAGREIPRSDRFWIWSARMRKRSEACCPDCVGVDSEKHPLS